MLLQKKISALFGAKIEKDKGDRTRAGAEFILFLFETLHSRYNHSFFKNLGLMMIFYCYWKKLETKKKRKKKLLDKKTTHYNFRHRYRHNG
jgi:hypothetical protein